MLDIHPAHHAASTWRDFFIHITTIVLGLLIAIGLEQTVEWMHHRHQLHQLEADLHTEGIRNLHIALDNIHGSELRRDADAIVAARHEVDAGRGGEDVTDAAHASRMADQWLRARSEKTKHARHPGRGLAGTTAAAGVTAIHRGSNSIAGTTISSSTIIT